MKVGVVIPAYNEHECIGKLVIEVKRFVPDSQIVVVDDSPNEATADALKELLSDSVHLIRRQSKGGRGTAVIEGVKFLMGRDVEAVVEMDADFSHPPAQIPELVKKSQEEGLDLLIASRYLPTSQIKNWPIKRHVFSFFSNKLARAVLSVPICDYTNGFRVYSRRAALLVGDTCGKLGTGFIALSETLVHLYYRGYRVKEVPTVFVNRVRGESSLNSTEIKNALSGLVRIHGLKRELIRRTREGVAKGSH